MSYTPDDQKFEYRSYDDDDRYVSLPDNAIEALEAMEKPILARLKDRDKWKESHLEFLEGILEDITAMKIKLMKLR